jgi:hypothetical protein
VDSNLLTRLVAPILPLVVIAIIAGAAGYALTSTAARPVPPLEARDTAPQGVRGVVQTVNADQLSLTLEDGSTRTVRIQSGAPIEVLRAISRAEVQTGDWLNAGAIPHAQTVLALVGIVVIDDPVVNTP